MALFFEYAGTAVGDSLSLKLVAQGVHAGEYRKLEQGMNVATWLTLEQTRASSLRPHALCSLGRRSMHLSRFRIVLRN